VIGNRNATVAFLKKHAIAIRKGDSRDEEGRLVHAMHGYVACETCGHSVLSTAEVAEIVGVGDASVSKWLKRESVRADIAAKLHASFKAVRE